MSSLHRLAALGIVSLLTAVVFFWTLDFSHLDKHAVPHRRSPQDLKHLRPLDPQKLQQERQLRHPIEEFPCGQVCVTEERELRQLFYERLATGDPQSAQSAQSAQHAQNAPNAQNGEASSPNEEVRAAPKLWSFLEEFEGTGLFSPVLRKPIICQNILHRVSLPGGADTPGDWPPAREIPDHLDEFTQNGQMPLLERQFVEVDRIWGPAGEPSLPVVRTHEGALELREKLKSSNRKYGNQLTPVFDQYSRALEKHKVQRMAGAVLGDATPWLEAQLLNMAATHITIITPNRVQSTYQRISGSSLTELAARRLNETDFKGLDFVATFGILQRLGLGSFGEPLNPYGDLEAAAQIWCLLKPGGYFYLGAKVSPRSHLVFNSHRSYGPERLKHVGASFEQLGHFGGWDGLAVFVYRKPLQG